MQSQYFFCIISNTLTHLYTEYAEHSLGFSLGTAENQQHITFLQGHAAKNNGINGDLLVVIEEQEHPNLKRDGNNLYYTKVISLPDAILGADVDIPCVCFYNLDYII